MLFIVKKINSKRLAMPVISIIIAFFIYSNIAYSAAQEPDIKVNFDQYFIQASNLKPGDIIIKTLTVQNRGNNDFNYSMKASFKTGSKKLFNEFRLKISGSNETIFEGKLGEFQKLESRFLPAISEEDLKVQFAFPYEIGNEYQGLSAEFELKFIVDNIVPNPSLGLENPIESIDTDQEESVDSVRPIPNEKLNSPPTRNQILPSTATDMFNNLLIGLVLILGGIGLVIIRNRKNNFKRNDPRP